MYGSTTKGDVVKWSDCILVYGSTTKGDVVKWSDCIFLIYVYNAASSGYKIWWICPKIFGLALFAVILGTQKCLVALTGPISLAYISYLRYIFDRG